ncbi:MAG: hypothetical protein EAZ44_07180 [Cytophagia bacterium]|nr:MAG: hypothetical protein EAZ44_07180 [Cytophagia bacterium]TAG41792.1 MAG: hypothetical protein EAZ31_07050 [Cytophagia bacterium]
MQNKLKSIILLFLFLHFFAPINAQSVLREGIWLKIPIKNKGVYKITPAFLRNFGINTNNINPKNFHIYGNGGGMLPQNNSTTRAIDLVENAIFVQGENDNTFDETDYILFYAQDANSWQYQETTQNFIHQKNLYDDVNYYFLTFNTTQGLRIAPQNNITTTANITTFDDYFFYENDLENVLRSGREWYGEGFGGNYNRNEMDFNFNLSGLIPNSNFKLTCSAMGKDVNATNYQWLINNQLIGTQSVPAQALGTWALRGIDATNTFTQNTNIFNNNENITIKFRFLQNSNTGLANINYFRLQFQRKLQLYANQTQFRSILSLNNTNSNFIIENTNNQNLIWDITNALQPKNQLFISNNNIANFGSNTQNQLKEFIVFNPSQIPTPETAFSVTNQNLSGQNVPNLLIITHESLIGEANRLADFRRTNDNLSALIVTPSQIYNEFSSGRQDVSALRDFCRQLFKKNPTNFKYLLLLGAASYDYKARLRDVANMNLVPIYQAYESLNPIFSFSSDDYFGILGDNKGTWEETPTGDANMDIGVGRIPARNPQEAKVVVDKLIKYVNNTQNLGNWRQQVTFVADDGDANTHQNDAESLTQIIDQNYPQFKTKKLYLDSFNQISSPNGETCPEIVDALDDVVESGSLIVNYSGHGGEVGWAEEAILRTQQIEAFRNRNNLPLFVTATCEFGRYDNPYTFSGAERVLFNQVGGGIGLLTTTRPVFSSTNLILNRAFYNSVFEPINNEMPRLGDVMRKTKNGSLVGAINRNFALLGDPSMRLAYPNKNIKIIKVNDKITLPFDTMRAVRKMKLEGNITNNNGNIDNSFNGILEIEVFDKPNFEQTKGTAGTIPMNYQVRNSVLFRGTAQVTNGTFFVEFVIPKDINYAFDKGRIVMYAKDMTQVTDAGGGEMRLIVGGSMPNVNADNTPPNINLFLNDESFKNGQEVSPDALLLANIFDENGINIAVNGVGHAIKAVLDNTISFDLNDYYKANQNDYKNGKVEYPIKNMKPGKHNLTLQVWDTYNNPSQTSIDFVVAPSPQIAIQTLFNYPNPVVDYTKFSFTHNKKGKDLYYQIDIFDTKGSLLKTLTGQTLGTEQENVILEWDGIDKNGQRLGNGTYIYQLQITSPQDKTSGKASRKLVIIN